MGFTVGPAHKEMIPMTGHNTFLILRLYYCGAFFLLVDWDLVPICIRCCFSIAVSNVSIRFPRLVNEGFCEKTALPTFIRTILQMAIARNILVPNTIRRATQPVIDAIAESNPQNHAMAQTLPLGKASFRWNSPSSCFSTTPFSVTMQSMRSWPVTSNAGFHAPVRSAATAISCTAPSPTTSTFIPPPPSSLFTLLTGRPLIVVTSIAGRSSIGISAPDFVAKSIVVHGAATTNLTS